MATREDAKMRIRIKIKAYDHQLADQSASQISSTVMKYGADLIGPIPLPTDKRQYTVLKSPFVHKDARDQFEMRVHKRLIDILDPSSKVIDALQNLNIPFGVNIELKNVV